MVNYSCKMFSLTTERLATHNTAYIRYGQTNDRQQTDRETTTVDRYLSTVG